MASLMNASLTSPLSTHSRSVPAIVVGGLIVGFVDLLYAIVVYSPSRPIRVPQTIAAGILGSKSYQGGMKTAVLMPREARAAVNVGSMRSAFSRYTLASSHRSAEALSVAIEYCRSASRDCVVTELSRLLRETVCRLSPRSLRIAAESVSTASSTLFLPSAFTNSVVTFLPEATSRILAAVR